MFLIVQKSSLSLILVSLGINFQKRKTMNLGVFLLTVGSALLFVGFLLLLDCGPCFCSSMLLVPLL